MKKIYAIFAMLAALANQATAEEITPLNGILDNSVWTRADVTEAQALQYFEDFGIRCSAVYYSAAKDALATPDLNYMADTFTEQASVMMLVGASAIAARSNVSAEHAITEFAQPRVVYVGNLLQDVKFKERAAHGASDSNSVFWQDMKTCQAYYQTVKTTAFDQ